MGKPRPKCPDCGCQDPPQGYYCHWAGIPTVQVSGIWNGNGSAGWITGLTPGLCLHPAKSVNTGAVAVQGSSNYTDRRSGLVFDCIDAGNYHALMRDPSTNPKNQKWELVRVQDGGESVVGAIFLPLGLNGVSIRHGTMYAVGYPTYDHLGYRSQEEYTLGGSPMGGRFVGVRTDHPAGDTIFGWRFFSGESAAHMCFSNRGASQGQHPHSLWVNFGGGGLTDDNCGICDQLFGAFNLTWQPGPFGYSLRHDLGICDFRCIGQTWTIQANLRSKDGGEYWVVRVGILYETSPDWAAIDASAGTTSTCPRASAIYESGNYAFETFENNSGFPVPLSLKDSHMKDWCGGAFPSLITLSL